MSTFRGMDGSVTIATNVVAEVVSWSLNVARDLLEDTAMLDAAKTYKAGLNDWEGQLTCHLDYGDTLGQKALIDNILNSSGATVALELIVATGKKFSGTAVPTSMQINQEKTSIVSVAFGFKAASALAVSWV